MSIAIGCSKVATKRHFLVVVTICTNSVQTDYLIKCTKLAVLDFFDDGFVEPVNGLIKKLFLGLFFNFRT